MEDCSKNPGSVSVEEIDEQSARAPVEVAPETSEPGTTVGGFFPETQAVVLASPLGNQWRLPDRIMDNLDASVRWGLRNTEVVEKVLEAISGAVGDGTDEERYTLPDAILAVLDEVRFLRGDGLNLDQVEAYLNEGGESNDIEPRRVGR